MKTATELYQEFEAATNAYLEQVAAFTQEELNATPFEGSWTAAQVTDHLCLSDKGMISTLNGPAEPTTRAVDEKVASIRAMFLDFSTKMQSPDFIVPPQRVHDKNELIAAFKAGREQIGKAIQTLDLTTTCHLPIFQDPTRLELINFVNVHTMRHTNQVKHIAEKLQPARENT